MSLSRLVAVAILLSGAARAQTTEVQVVNNADHPVPVQVERGTVNVQNTPTGPLVVAVDPATPVTVTQVADQSSVTALGICKAANHPSTPNMQCTFSDSLGPIPPGHHFVVDNVSFLQQSMPSGTHPLVLLSIFVQAHGLSGEALFPVPVVSTYQGGGLWASSGDLIGVHAVVASSGFDFSLVITYNKSLPSTFIESTTNAAMTGHFVAVVPQLQPPH